MVFLLVLQALWLIAPAYIANGFPPVVRGKRPLDSGRYLGKNRLFGDGKTVEGTIGGVLAGVLAGWLQVSYQNQIPADLGLAEMTLPLVVALSAGAIFGDLAGAFVKRRMGIRRGDPALLLDQLDFLVVALLAAGLFYAPEKEVIIALFLLTPPIHWLTNFFAYRLKIKKTPW